MHSIAVFADVVDWMNVVVEEDANEDVEVEDVEDEDKDEEDGSEDVVPSRSLSSSQ